MREPEFELRKKLLAYLTAGGAREAGLKRRDYQINAASRLVANWYRRKNSLLPLPTGTGKTLISNLFIRAVLEQSPGMRALIVAPRRVLVSQHSKYLNWMAESVGSFALTDQSVSSPARTSKLINGCSVLITTPELFANQVIDGLIDQAGVNSFRVVIVDEFDAFLRPEFTDFGCACRFHDAFDRCLKSLSEDARFVLMSATSPVVTGTFGAHLPEVIAASKHVKAVFRPTTVEVPVTSFRKFVPVTKLVLRAVQDSRASALSLAVSEEISMLLTVLEDIHTGAVNRPWVLARIDGLSEGHVRHVRLKRGDYSVVDSKVRRLFSRIRRMVYLRSFVYEDMGKGLSAERCDVTTVRDPVTGKSVKFRNRVRLRGLTEQFEHHPQLGGKAEVVRRLVGGAASVVVMVRYVRLLETLGSLLSKSGVSAVGLHGEMDDRARDRALDEFKSGRARVLLMTRDTGKRGLDLPQARAAVFYSPKASETSTFQEASRIRSTTSDVKDCHMLFYDDTDEVEKLQRLVEQIEARQDRAYRIVRAMH